MPLVNAVRSAGLPLIFTTMIPSHCALPGLAI